LGEFIAAFCGPLAGILAAVIMSYAALRVPSEFLLCTAGVSFVLSVFNLIPAGPLDGGRILHVILQKLFGERFADRALLLCGAVCSLALFYLGLWFLARGDGLALALAGLWLFICVITGDAPRRRAAGKA
jgi:membrane-associated protease RseP (regulator of RpoE activity)